MTTKQWTKKGFTPVRDHYQEVTDSLVKAIESAISNNTRLPWTKSWKSLGALRNGDSNRPYHGVNTLILGLSSYADPRWLTFNQVSNLGGSVKGQKGTNIVQPKLAKD